MGVVQDDLLRLRRLDACAVSDALDQLGLPPSVTGLACVAGAGRIFGRVLTVRLAAGQPPVGHAGRHLCTGAVERARPGDMIVVEQRTGIEAAGWGGILSNAAKLKGISGTIVEGFARDVDEAAELAYPIYARGGTARTARGRVHEAENGGVIRVGETDVYEGDYVVADRSGAAFIPAAHLDAVLAAAERIALREAMMTKAVLRGEAVSDVMGASYETMLSQPVESAYG